MRLPPDECVGNPDAFWIVQVQSDGSAKTNEAESAANEYRPWRALRELDPQYVVYESRSKCLVIQVSGGFSHKGFVVVLDDSLDAGDTPNVSHASDELCWRVGVRKRETAGVRRGKCGILSRVPRCFAI